MELAGRIIDFGKRLDSGEQRSGVRSQKSELGALQRGMICLERARNGEGQYAPESGEGGLEPASATKVYGPPAARVKRAQPGGRALLAGAGALTAAGLLTRRLRMRSLLRQ